MFALGKVRGGQKSTGGKQEENRCTAIGRKRWRRRTSVP